MAEIVYLGKGEFRIQEGTRSRVAYAAGPPEERWVFLDGQVYVLDVSGRAEPGQIAGRAEGLPHSRRVAQPFGAAKRSRDHSALAAPMPATVVAINVEPGQRVSRGDVLIVLEAMKMELPVKAPRDGTVKGVACRAGELVQPGVALLELE